MDTAAICFSVKPSSGQQAGRLFLLPSCGIRARSDKILAAVLAFEQLLRTRGGAGFLATPTADSLSSCCSLRNSLGEASTYPFPPIRITCEDFYKHCKLEKVNFEKLQTKYQTLNPEFCNYFASLDFVVIATMSILLNPTP